MKIVDDTWIFWVIFTASFWKLFWNSFWVPCNILSWLKLDTVSQFLLCFSCSSQTLISAGSEFTWVFWGQSSTLITCQDTDKTTLNLQDDYHLHSSLWCGLSEHLWNPNKGMNALPAEKQIFPVLLQTAEGMLLLSSKYCSLTLSEGIWTLRPNTLRDTRFQSSSLRSFADLYILCKQTSLQYSSH